MIGQRSATFAPAASSARSVSSTGSSGAPVQRRCSSGSVCLQSNRNRSTSGSNFCSRAGGIRPFVSSAVWMVRLRHPSRSSTSRSKCSEASPPENVTPPPEDL